MRAAVVTGREQVTIPKEIRRQAGVKPGDKVLFRTTDAGQIVIAPCGHGQPECAGRSEPEGAAAAGNESNADATAAALRLLGAFEADRTDVAQHHDRYFAGVEGA